MNPVLRAACCGWWGAELYQLTNPGNQKETTATATRGRTGTDQAALTETQTRFLQEKMVNPLSRQCGSPS